MRVITEINIHASATKPQWMAGRTIKEKVAEIRRWHVEDNGWHDIAYHFVIDRDGMVNRGRKAEMVGAFEPKCNARALGVCLVGGYGSNANDQFEQHYTPEQDQALRKLIRIIQHQHPTATKITGHNDYANKACPGFNVARWLARKPARTFAESGTVQGSGVAAAAGGGLAAVEVAKAFATEAKTAVVEVQAAKAEVQADPVDPLRWVFLILIVGGALFVMYRRWADWQAGRQ
jgi:N-acetylmuramoyl-L-alanine amidase